MTKEFDTADYALDTIVGASGITLGQMVMMYRQAPKKGKQLRALCEMSGMKEEQIKALLLAHGVSPMEMPRKREKADGNMEPIPPANAADRNLPVDAMEAFDRAITAVNNLADVFKKYVAAYAASLKKLERIKEFLDREGVHADEP